MATFGDLLNQHLSRKRDLSQNKLAVDINVDPSVISRMCNGERLNGRYSRKRVLKIIAWLNEKGVLSFTQEADSLLQAAKMPPLLRENREDEAILVKLDEKKEHLPLQRRDSKQDRTTMLIILAILVIHILEKTARILNKEKVVVVVNSTCCQK